MSAPGPALAALPIGTEVIPHSRTMRMLRERPDISRMASGGIVAEKELSRNSRNITNQVIINAAMLNEQTVREADLRIKRLERRRVRA